MSVFTSPISCFNAENFSSILPAKPVSLLNFSNTSKTVENLFSIKSIFSFIEEFISFSVDFSRFSITVNISLTFSSNNIKNFSVFSSAEDLTSPKAS